MAGREIFGDIRLELVRGIPVPVRHDRFVTLEQRAATARHEFQVAMLSEAVDPDQDEVPGPGAAVATTDDAADGGRLHSARRVCALCFTQSGLDRCRRQIEDAFVIHGDWADVHGFSLRIGLGNGWFRDGTSEYAEAMPVIPRRRRTRRADDPGAPKECMHKEYFVGRLVLCLETRRRARRSRLRSAIRR
jgi:hypothetical protein